MRIVWMMSRRFTEATRRRKPPDPRHRARILHVQQVSRVGEKESLDLRQPGEQKFLSLAEDRRDLRTLSSQDGEDRLCDADRLLPRKRPLSHRR